jgi:hypothetical protein
MKSVGLIVLAALAAGCGANSIHNAGGTMGDDSENGKSSSGGKSGSRPTVDAGANPSGWPAESEDADWRSSTMNGAAPPFDWDAGTGGNGGTTGTGGRGGSSGGSTGAGGTGGHYADAGTSTDSNTGTDTGKDASASRDGGVSPDASAPHGPDAGACTVRIRALRPVSLTHLVAGPHVQVVVRAERDGTATGTWTWRGLRDRTTSVAAEIGQQDAAAAAFTIDQPGTYVFTASDNSGCQASITAYAKAADACTACNQGAIVRVSAPPSTQIPVQTGYVSLNEDVVPQAGVQVQVGPSVGRSRVDAYVRILCDSVTVADGLSDLRNLFTTRLLSSRPSGATVTQLQYNVLVVPADGTGNGTIAATAPQLFRDLSPADFATTSFQLTDGVAITGTTHLKGDVLADARWVLSNQGPGRKASGNLLFSSVGRSDSAGAFHLNAQPGSYWVTVSPPADRGLAEAISAASVSVDAGTTFDFTWATPVTATVNLRVQDAEGQPLPRATVRLSTAEAQPVGTLSVQGPSGDLEIQANGRARLEATTSSAGVATFTGVPANVTYNVLIVPEALGPAARTTAVTLRVTPGAFSSAVTTQAEAHITGRLATGTGAHAIDLSQVTIMATDKAEEAAEPVQSVRADSEGRFDVAVTPGRIYVLMAVPPSDSDYARTFVGPGRMMATEFPITQVLFLGRPWKANVLAQDGQPLPGTALQMFCDANWPNCIDPTMTLAETTAASDGSFATLLPDPTTR